MEGKEGEGQNKRKWVLLVVRVMIFFLEECRRGGEARGLSNPLGLPFPNGASPARAQKRHGDVKAGPSRYAHAGWLHARESQQQHTQGPGPWIVTILRDLLGERATTPTTQRPRHAASHACRPFFT